MILKQNCYVLTEAEINALETDTYTSPKKTTYTGSSIQRRIKNTDFFETSNENTTNPNSKAKPNPKKVRTKPKSDEPIEHKLSDRSKAKIRQKVTAWSNCIPVKQAVKFIFVTLTLTSKQIGTDKDFTKMQNVLFTYLRKYVPNFRNYLYTLERQGNGNLHSHILVSSYIPVQKLNLIWCKILSDHGYTYNQKGNIVTPLEAYKNYMQDKSLGCPSPVDVSLVHNISHVSKYVTKYITKSTSSVYTSVWNCSQSISKIWTGARICPKKYLLHLEQFKEKTIKKMMDNGQEMYINILKHYTGLQKKIFFDVNFELLYT